jgi:type II secretory pathway pseudopilin PulG
MNTRRHSQAFSIIELLITLSVLALLTTALVPRFTAIHEEATNTATQVIQEQLNHIYASWRAAGGLVGTNPYTSDIIAVLVGIESTPGQIVQRGSSETLVNDSTQAAANIRISNLPTPPIAVAATAPSTTVVLGNTVVWYDKPSDSFMACAQSAVDNAHWTVSGGGGRPANSTTQQAARFPGYFWNVDTNKFASAPGTATYIGLLPGGQTAARLVLSTIVIPPSQSTYYQFTASTTPVSDSPELAKLPPFPLPLLQLQ